MAGPRARHPEAGLDLCYVTDYSRYETTSLYQTSCSPRPTVIVTSGPSSVWPKKAYRNPTDQLVAFLDRKHGQDWSIFEFRAEGTGYPDSEVYGRIHHFPWPDHHPPPFAIIPNLMAAMRNWIQRTDEGGLTDGKEKRIAVVHCKAGKGRSGTSACSYLISQEGWKTEDALQRFTGRRMRVGFGNGVSIPSQLRWVGYVNRWTNELNKKYVERPVEILEIHIYGLRDGVKVAVEGYVDGGKRIEVFHTFTRHEKIIIEESTDTSSSGKQAVPSRKIIKPPLTETSKNDEKETLISPIEPSSQSNSSFSSLPNPFSPTIQTILLRPEKPLILPSSDINIDFERRSQASSYTGFTMVTSIAHVWFNAYFEGGHKEDQNGNVFEIEWEAMDGIKGSPRKGSKALESLKVVWRYAKSPDENDPVPSPAQADSKQHLQVDTRTDLGRIITEPTAGEKVEEGEAADWRGEDVNPAHEAGAKKADGVDSGRSGASLLTMATMVKAGAGSLSKELGLRPSNPDSAQVSRATSPERASKVQNTVTDPENEESDKAPELVEDDSAETDEFQGVRTHGPEGEEHIGLDGSNSTKGEIKDTDSTRSTEVEREGRADTKAGKNMELGMGKLANIIAKMKGDGKDKK